VGAGKGLPALAPAFLKGKGIEMRITIESTEKITELDGVKVRVWDGVTEKGIHCKVFVHRLAVRDMQDTTQFEQELKEMPEPKSQPLPLRMVLD